MRGLCAIAMQMTQQIHVSTRKQGYLTFNGATGVPYIPGFRMSDLYFTPVSQQMNMFRIEDCCEGRVHRSGLCSHGDVLVKGAEGGLVLHMCLQKLRLQLPALPAQPPQLIHQVELQRAKAVLHAPHVTLPKDIHQCLDVMLGADSDNQNETSDQPQVAESG